MTLAGWGNGSDAQRRVADAMATYAAENHVDFIMTLGDNFFDGVESPEDPWFDERWKDVYFIYESLENLTWYITVGEHDYYPYQADSPKEWNQVWRHAIDDYWYMPHLWYCVHFLNTSAGNVSIWMLDSHAMTMEVNDWNQQLAWLEEDLAESDADFKVFAAHHAGYSNTSLGSSTVRKYLLPLMEQYDVDMYLSGHDENMQHIQNCTADVREAPDHIIIGTNVTGSYEEQQDAMEDLESKYNMCTGYMNDGINGFGVITFNETGMHVDMYSEDNELLYTYSRPPADSYWVLRTITCHWNIVQNKVSDVV